MILKDKNVKKQILRYSTAELFTDTGFLFEDMHKTEFLEYEGLDWDFAPPQSTYGNYLTSVEFYVSKNFRSYSRVYIRFSDALANVGGIMSLFTLVIEILFNYYRKNAYLLFLQEQFVRLNQEVVEVNNSQIRIVNRSYLNSNIKSVNKQVEFSIMKLKNEEIVVQPDSSKEIINNQSSIIKENKSLRKYKKQDIILNKEINEVIEFKKHKLVDVSLTFSERCYFKYCCYNRNKTGNEEINLKHNLYLAANKEINRRIEILEYIKMMDQFRLLSKIILNKNQCYMLKNREFHRVIDNKLNITSVEEELKLEEIEKENKQRLKEYLFIRKNENCLNQTDILLFKYMQNDLKAEISNEINLD